MSPQSRAVLVYLREYLAAHPAESPELAELHLKRTKRVLRKGHRWKHLSLKVLPNLDTALVYLCFLHSRRQLLPAKKPGDLFRFAKPELLKR